MRPFSHSAVTTPEADQLVWVSIFKSTARSAAVRLPGLASPNAVRIIWSAIGSFHQPPPTRLASSVYSPSRDVTSAKISRHCRAAEQFFGEESPWCGFRAHFYGYRDHLPMACIRSVGAI